MRRMALAGALLLATSCAEEPEPVAIVPTASAELPSVELVHLAGIGASYVDARIHNIAVDTTGRIAFYPTGLSATPSWSTNRNVRSRFASIGAGSC